jgi:hypothetical protein
MKRWAMAMPHCPLAIELYRYIQGTPDPEYNFDEHSLKFI